MEENESRIENVCFVIACVSVLFLAGCSHQAQFAAAGKVFRIGNESANIMYVNGLVAFNGTRENAESTFETNDNDGLGDPADVKTVRTVRLKTGPIVSGYLVDLSKKCPDAAVKYVEQMPEINKSVVEPVKTEPAKESSTIVHPFMEKLKSKLKELAGDKADEYKSPFSDNCELTNLYEHPEVEYQAALTADLLKYADDEATMVDTGELCKETLIHYAGRLAQLKAKGIAKATKITLGKATIKNGRLTYLRYRLLMADGTYQDEDCPNCFDLEDK